MKNNTNEDTPVKKRVYVSLFILFALVAMGCHSEEPEQAVKTRPPTIQGMYEGTLPCADCPGIKTYITFFPDGSVVRTARYEDRNGDCFTDRGTWKMQNGLVAAAFPHDDTRHYAVKSDTTIALVDAQGKESETMPKAYILTKADPKTAISFEGHYALTGKGPEAYDQSLNIKKVSDSRVEVMVTPGTGHKGCRFTGRGTIINDQIEIPLKDILPSLNSTMIIRFAPHELLEVSTARSGDQADLAEFCDGKGSLAGDYREMS